MKTYNWKYIFLNLEICTEEKNVEGKIKGEKLKRPDKLKQKWPTSPQLYKLL